ncbi:MAG: DUF3015 family protein [Nitrospira sp.]|nr:DUF3015 family protein [Nitrospira sp.]
MDKFPTHSLRLANMMFCLLVVLSACDATVEIVKAPFDATTAVSNGTTKASSEFTEPTKEFSSSTTPGSRVGSDDLIRAKQRVHTFAASNFGNLQHEIAQGRGEYLTSLATLAEIPPRSQPELFHHLQARYTTLYTADQSPADVTYRLVNDVWVIPLGMHGE